MGLGNGWSDTAMGCNCSHIEEAKHIDARHISRRVAGRAARY